MRPQTQHTHTPTKAPPAKHHDTLSLLLLAAPLLLVACGDGTDPGTTGAVEADPPAVVEPADPAADPVVVDPVAPTNDALPQ